jgi:group II intron reverse transcriptase/maturase
MTPLPLKEARERVQALQVKLYRAAKDQQNLRFYSLWDKVNRDEVLIVAWNEVRQNRGAPGVDAQTIDEIEKHVGVDKYLEEVQNELRRHVYKVLPVRRVYIPKADGKSKRPLGIPTVRDRVVQAAVRLVIEPIFEAGFSDCSYGFRPGRSAKDASVVIRKWLNFGLENVLDADIQSYFDTIPHDGLMNCVGQRIADGSVLRLIRAWLRAGVLEKGEVQPTELGTPQGGVISPLLANIYLDQLDKSFEKLGLCRKGLGEARLVRYADDFVVLCAGPVEPVRIKVQAILEELGLTLKMEKTREVKAEDGLEFLGFRCSRRKSEQHKKRITLILPSQKSEKRARESIRALVGRHMLHVEPIRVVERLNQFLRGWTNYYKHTNAAQSFQKLQNYCNQKVRRYLQRRKLRKGHGYKAYPNGYLYGVLKLENIAYGRLERVRS